MSSPYGPRLQVHKQRIPSIRRPNKTGRHSAHAATRYRQAHLFSATDRVLSQSSMAPPPRRNPQQNPTRRKVRAHAPANEPRPRRQFRNPNSLVYSLLSQGEEPWLAASLRPANFLPGLAIGFLLGLLLDLSSSWRPKSSSAPAPRAAAARGSSSKRASGSSFASGGEELKMVSCAASVPREYIWRELFVAAATLCIAYIWLIWLLKLKYHHLPFVSFGYSSIARINDVGSLIFVSSIAALFELHNSRVELALSNVSAICRF